MVPYLYGPRDHHLVKTLEAYRAKQRTALARKAKAGGRAIVHDVTTPALARVDNNSWIIDCECGAGNATDPAMPVACCFGCGAVHTAIVFPADAAAIERVLLERPIVTSRHWRPGETLETLRAENLEHGIGRP